MKRIFFIGYMGVGKSHVAREFSKYAECPWVDLDEAIEKSSGQSIASIFENRGEAYFRRLEKETLDQVLKDTMISVVACGGGTTRRVEARRKIAGAGHVIHLNPPSDVLIPRLRNGRDRPSLMREGRCFTDREIQNHWSERQPYYAFAHEEIVRPVSVADFQRWKDLLNRISP
jgi:shikimate kinase